MRLVCEDLTGSEDYTFIPLSSRIMICFARLA